MALLGAFRVNRQTFAKYDCQTYRKKCYNATEIYLFLPLGRIVVYLKSFLCHVLERHRSIPVKRAECVLLGPPDRLAKQSGVEFLGGGGSSLIVYPI